MKIHITLIAIIICFVACEKDKYIISSNSTATISESENNNQDCLSIEAYKDELLINAGNDLLVTEVEYTAENYVVHYATGESLPICKDSLFCWQFNPNNWQVDFQFMDSSITQAIFWADSFQVEIQTELNPSGYAPLNAIATIQSALNCKIEIEVIGQDGVYSSVTKNFDPINTEHEVPILGLYADYLNQVKITASSNNFIIKIDTITIQTNSINVPVPEIIVDVNQTNQMQLGFHLINIVQLPQMAPFIIDPFGKVRWYIDYATHPELNNLVFDLGFVRMINGNYLFPDRQSSVIHEADIHGNLINSWPMGSYRFHHSVTEKPNGNFLVTSQHPDNDHLFGGTSVEDQIIEIDRSTGAIVKVWDLRYILDETRIVHWDFDFGSLKDWAHLNEVIYDDSDNTIVFSAKHQSAVCKVDYNDNIRWILAPDSAWGSNRNNMEVQPFLLTAVDNNNQPYNNAIQSGVENIEAFEWAWFQHAIKKIGPNRYLLFDNGNERNYGTSEDYSRAVIYQIDEENMTVKQEWTYGRDRGIETYSGCCSDVVYYEDTNHIIWSPGYRVDNGSGMGGKVIEIDYATKNVIFEARINYPGFEQMHRSRRLHIYPN